MKFINLTPQSGFQMSMVSVTAMFMLAAQLFTSAPQTKTYDSNIRLNLNSEFPLVSPDTQPKIKLVQSEHEKKEAKAKAMSRSVIPRRAPSRTEGVPLEQKRALVKETAKKYAIDWKILEAVWQVESGKSWDTWKKSYAGATGPMQFMPSTFRAYKQDGDGDGRAEIHKAKDALASAANFLAENGLADGKVDQALLSYNHSLRYVNRVKRVANSIVE